MENFVQLSVTGLANGAILALAALGFVIIYKATGVINFAQGQFLAVGAYAVWWAIERMGWPWPVAVGFALVLGLWIGAAVERLVLRPLVGERAIAVIMITIGLASVLQAILQILFGTAPKPFPPFIPNDPVTVLGATVPTNRLGAIVIALVTLALFSVFFLRTRNGIAMRAVADDQQAALVMGISVRRIFALSWALAAVTAVIGGVLVANLIGVSGEVQTFGLMVFPVVILGGLDSIPGTLVGGVIIGLLTTYTAGYVGQGLQQVLPFVVVALMLMAKPYGLFGQVRIERV